MENRQVVLIANSIKHLASTGEHLIDNIKKEIISGWHEHMVFSESSPPCQLEINFVGLRIVVRVEIEFNEKPRFGNLCAYLITGSEGAHPTEVPIGQRWSFDDRADVFPFDKTGKRSTSLPGSSFARVFVQQVISDLLEMKPQILPAAFYATSNKG